jgi:ubiquinone/menaquinone biosynthesis C-methylase UbiE
MKTDAKAPPRFSDVPIQQVQAYWDARPCNVTHSEKPIGSREYFDEVEKRKFFVEPHLAEFADFPSVKDKKVLEIGCGLGTTTINFARAGAKKVTAVDFSKKSLELARQRAVVYGFSHLIEFYHANAEELSNTVPREEYDLIFSFGVIHHTPHPEKVLEELHAYLAPGGAVKIMLYHRYSWKTLWILFKYGGFKFWRFSKLIAAFSEAQEGCPITYTYSKKEAEELFETKGFQAVSLKVDHIFPYRIQDYVQRRYVKVWYFRWMPQRLFRALEKKIGWHLCVTARKMRCIDARFHPAVWK